MRILLAVIAAVCLAAAVPSSVRAQAISCASLTTGPYANFGSFRPFPASHPFNTDISDAPADPTATAAYLTDWAAGHIHPDTSTPYNIVDSNVTRPVTITYPSTAYTSQSDITPQPLDQNTLIEGNPADCSAVSSDQHTLVIDKATCTLYENAVTQRCKGAFTVNSSTAIWDLTSIERRPYGFTSADAAGLPILPLVVRYDEVAAGAVNHALRMTFTQTRIGHDGPFFVDPATHGAGDCCYGSSLVMGNRLRLKASFDVSSFSPAAQTILNAMKHYGVFVADNGYTGAFQIANDPRWGDGTDLAALATVSLSNFEVLTSGPVYATNAAATGPSPTITNLAATASTGPGTAVTLTWQQTGSSYDYIEEAGPARNGTLLVAPQVTTTYDLVSSNQFGRASGSITVTVPPAVVPPPVTTPPAGTWIKAGNEGDTFGVPAGAVVRYGSGTSFDPVRTFTTATTFVASNSFFGADPLKGTVKELDVENSLAGVTRNGTPLAPATGTGTPTTATTTVTFTCTASVTSAGQPTVSCTQQ